MRSGVLKTANLGWNSILFVCYFCWSLERFRLVDSTTSKYSAWNNCCGTSCAEDKQFFLTNKTEKIERATTCRNVTNIFKVI